MKYNKYDYIIRQKSKPETYTWILFFILITFFVTFVSWTKYYSTSEVLKTEIFNCKVVNVKHNKSDNTVTFINNKNHVFDLYTSTDIDIDQQYSIKMTLTYDCMYKNSKYFEESCSSNLHYNLNW